MEYMYSTLPPQSPQTATNLDCFKICISAWILIKLVKAFWISLVPPFSTTMMQVNY